MREQVEDNRGATNVGRFERLVTGAVGGWMVFRGLSRPSLRGLILAGSGIALVYRGATGRSRLYRKLHVSGSASGRRAAARIPYQTGVKIEEAITVGRSPAELYQFWKHPGNLQQFMSHVQSVSSAGPGRSHWVVRGPVGATLEWDAEIIKDYPNELISWQSSPGSAVASAGSVRFTPREDGRGAEVRLIGEYKPLGGPPGAVVATLLGNNPRRQVARDLRRFKQLMEVNAVGP